MVFSFNTKISLQELVDIRLALQQRKPVTIKFDWASVEEIDNSATCFLLSIILEQQNNRVAISHVESSNNALAYFKKIADHPYQSIEIHAGSFGLFLTSVDNEEKLLNRRNQLLDFFKTNPTLKQKDLTQAIAVFAELYMNICQHSDYRFGFIHIAPIVSNKIEIVVSDLGTGIAHRIKSHFGIEMQRRSDSEAIWYATENFITTKTTAQNYGRGLNNLISLIETVKRELEIRSGRGCLFVNPKTGYTFNMEDHQLLEYDHPGTLIRASLDFRNFEELEKESFDETIEF